MLRWLPTRTLAPFPLLLPLLLVLAVLPAPPMGREDYRLAQRAPLCRDQAISAWGLDAVWAPQAQTITRGSPDVVVAVIDSGIDYTHPELAGHLWQNPREIAGNGVDDDGNGYVDDLGGYRFAPPRSGDTADRLGHGTFVASIIASVAPDVKLMALNVGDDLSSQPAYVIEAIHYATDNGASVINLSGGSQFPTRSMFNALNYALSHDVVVVLAAGNEGEPSGSAAFYPGTMAIAATDSRDHLADFSNFGDWIDVAAPGVDIRGALPGGRHGVCDGTSFSAPFVSGAAALVRSAYPHLAAADVIRQIDSTADNINPANPEFRGQLTFGRLNAFRALGGNPATVPPPATTLPTTAPRVAAAPALPPGGPQPGISNAPGGLGNVAVGGAIGALGSIGLR